MDVNGDKFTRLELLVGTDNFERLSNAHVMIFGMGGVGSWAAEGIVRSGIGRITLVDYDDVSPSNFNRQLPALESNLGHNKAEVVAERCRQINPNAKVSAVKRMFEEDVAEEFFTDRPNYVIDAIDHVTAKCFLLQYCQCRDIPIVTSTGSADRMDPTQIKIADLGQTATDPLAKWVRKILRKKYGFPSTGDMGITAVYSPEPVESRPQSLDDWLNAARDQDSQDFSRQHTNRVVRGTASFVTGAFGLACASVVVRYLTGR